MKACYWGHCANATERWQAQRASATSLGSLFQYLTTPMVMTFFLVSNLTLPRCRFVLFCASSYWWAGSKDQHLPLPSPPPPPPFGMSQRQNVAGNSLHATRAVPATCFILTNISLLNNETSGVLAIKRCHNSISHSIAYRLLPSSYCL